MPRGKSSVEAITNVFLKSRIEIQDAIDLVDELTNLPEINASFSQTLRRVSVRLEAARIADRKSYESEADCLCAVEFLQSRCPVHGGNHNAS